MAGFESIVEKAKQAQEASNSGSSSNKYLFLGDGKTKIRLLYNPEHASMMREISRHWDGANKRHVPCGKMYGEECAVCDVKGIYEEQTGNTPDWKFNAQKRAIAWVTYFESEAKQEKLVSGDTALLVMPTSVYNKINDIIVNSSDNLGKLLAENTTMPIVITRKKTNNRTEYEVALDPFGSVTSIKEGTPEEAQAKFTEMLAELPSVDDAMFPMEINDDIRKNIKACYEGDLKRLGLTEPGGVSKVAATKSEVVDGPPQP